MGRKFEAERLIFYADRNALEKANSTLSGIDLFPKGGTFGTGVNIRFIQVKWSNGTMPARVISEVARNAKGYPSGQYLVESNYINQDSRRELERLGGVELPEIFLP